MESKVYTAQEMRDVANAIILPELATVAAMLRQAADAMEREAQREKKYEYAVRWFDGTIRLVSDDREEVQSELHCIDKSLLLVVSTVRRKVGEWEEVEDDYSKSPYDYKRVCRDAYEECRAIAEEGAKV